MTIKTDYKYGDKVVAKSKSVCGDLMYSAVAEKAKEIGQPFLYVKDFLKNGIDGGMQLSNGEDVLVLVENLDEEYGDYFLVSDVEPYVELTESQTESKLIKLPRDIVEFLDRNKDRGSLLAILQYCFTDYDKNPLFNYLYDGNHVAENFNIQKFINLAHAVERGYIVDNESEIDEILKELKIQYGTNGVEYAIKKLPELLNN